MKIVKPLKMEPLKLMIPSVKPRGGLLECESERLPNNVPSGQGNSMAWRQGFPKRSLQNSETAWPGELKKLVF